MVTLQNYLWLKRCLVICNLITKIKMLHNYSKKSLKMKKNAIFLRLYCSFICCMQYFWSKTTNRGCQHQSHCLCHPQPYIGSCSYIKLSLGSGTTVGVGRGVTIAPNIIEIEDPLQYFWLCAVFTYLGEQYLWL